MTELDNEIASATTAQVTNAAVQRVRALCETLDEEPLFHASLGSKELFHSNLIAWFVDHQPDAARQVFAPWSRPATGSVGARTERERRHLDLVIRLSDVAPLVIENKVFSPPRDKQLADYAKEVAPKYQPTPEFVLLSLSDPGWPSDQQQLGGQLWRHRSYRDLGAALNAAHKLVDDGYARETVKRYASIIQSLQELAQIVAVEVTDSMPFALPNPFATELEKIRLTQGFEKLRARSIAHYIQDRLATRQLGEVEIVDEYTRTWPLLEAFMHIAGTEDEIGWQYQEGQWRLAVRVRPDHDCHGPGATTRARRESYVTERYTTWFNFADADPVLGTSEYNAPKIAGFKGFAPNFVYLYRPARDVTVGQLCALAESTAQRTQTFNPSSF